LKNSLFNNDNPVVGASPRSRLAGVALNGLAGKDCELSWSTGVLEYWSVGKSESPNLIGIASFITPLLHHSITPYDSLVLSIMI
jgi:hypothetical protein